LTVVLIGDRGMITQARLEETASPTSIAQLGPNDTAIEEAARRGKTNAALSAIEGQRAALAGERQREAGALAYLQGERATVAAEGRQIETEAAPITYVAAVFGVAEQETAIRWLIAVMVLLL
jgi:hypothetical protein